MQLEKVIIENFRSYEKRTIIDFNDITTIVGKNDVGKSTVLEALEIFFNNSTVKIDNKDYYLKSDNKEVLIGCVFSGYKDEIIIDETATTSLQREYLLNSDGFLEIHKIYDCSNKTVKPEIYIHSLYPDEAVEKDKYLIQLTQTELRNKIKLFTSKESPINLKTNHLMRNEIFHSIDLSKQSMHKIQLKKGDTNKLWDKIQPTLPMFTLFQSDRSSQDGDTEVQDPMKAAVKEALNEVSDELENIEKIVREKALNVANSTLEKLKEMDPTLANELTPNIPEIPKWQSIFKLTLDTDEGIPVNKRGSGVRRLILLNFFRAAAEKEERSNIIYAIEEPETAQHPSNQILLAEALLELSRRSNTQVILTTHVPGFAGSLPVDSLRLILHKDIDKEILSLKNSGEVLDEISETLGVFPSRINNEVKVAIFVEGPNDVNIIKNLSKIVAAEKPEIVDLTTSNNVIIIPCGGDTLRGWVEDQYLKHLEIPEIHIYDRDNVDEGKRPKYEKYCQMVREREDESVAYLTSKREMENYIHPDAIKLFYNIEEDLKFSSDDDVPKLIASLTKYKENNVKRKLNNHVASNLTYKQIKEMDTEDDIEGKWLSFISKQINKSL